MCQEYSRSGDEVWKTKARRHDGHPTEMFQGHLHGEKHKNALREKHVISSMLAKGTISKLLTKGAENVVVQKRQCNRRVLKKLFKTLSRKKWAVKQNFEDVVNFIKELGDEDLIKHFSSVAKNATYLSHFSVDEYI